MLGKRLTRLRLLAGLTASELGQLAGLSRGTVSMIESGKRPDPSASTVERLTTVLGDQQSYLLSGKAPAPSGQRVRAAIRRAQRGGPRHA